MKSYLEALKNYIEQNPPNYGDAESTLGMLYAFTESDHFWFPNDLSQYGYRVGSRIQIMGYVDIYQRADGSVDYCLQPNSVKVHR